jgi:hypothetical protein
VKQLPFVDPTTPDKALEQIWTEIVRRQDAKPENARKFCEDPLGFVNWAWRWGQPGPLERFKGPDTWQKEFLSDLGEQVRARKFDGVTPVDPIKMSVSAGKGVGKSVLVGMLTTWIMQTWPYCQGTVTANTFSQLESKTWATIQQWFKTSRMASQFVIGGGSIRHRIHNKSWMVTPQTCREENAEAFAGQHAATSVGFYILDEASAISEIIWNTAISGCVDGMPMIFAFGNPTRSNGKFYQINFGKERERWNARTIDARECQIPNKKTLAEDVDYYGEDSDWVRVYIKGLPPKASDLQFIDSNRVWAAQKRTFEVLEDEPLVAGVDLARGGGDNAVIWFRRGDDARSIDPICIPGELVRDSMLMVSKLTELAGVTFGKQKVAMWFVDGGAMGGPIVDRIKQLGHENFVEVQFGAQAPDPRRFANMRAYMWSKMKDWLGERGAIPAKHTQLETDLTGVGLGREDKMARLVLESKESMKRRGLASPDWADALCLTWARPVGPTAIKKAKPVNAAYSRPANHSQGWMG